VNRPVRKAYALAPVQERGQLGAVMLVLDQNLQRIQDLLTARLTSFGRREYLTVNWQRPTSSQRSRPSSPVVTRPSGLLVGQDDGRLGAGADRIVDLVAQRLVRSLL
jgi:hypothetical protein